MSQSPSSPSDRSWLLRQGLPAFSTPAIAVHRGHFLQFLLCLPGDEANEARRREQAEQEVRNVGRPKTIVERNGTSDRPEINVHCRKRHDAEKRSYRVGHK